MPNRTMNRLLPYGLGLGLLGAAVHLGWEVTHGGVQSHHLFARQDLPAISNWWGLLVLPLFGWFTSRSVNSRTQANEDAAVNAVPAFFGSLLVGIGLSTSFAAGYESVTSGLFYATLATGLVLPIYRAEYVFGFVLSMTFVFGSVLPLIPASIAAGISAMVRFLVRPGFALLFRKVRT